MGEVPTGAIFAKRHQRGVGGDAIQPWTTHPGFAREPVKIAVCGQESVIRSILGGSEDSQDSIGQIEY